MTFNIPVYTVVQKLKGGIGNQLFQVLYGKRVASASKNPLEFDIKSYEQDTYQRTSILHRLWPEETICEYLPQDTTRVLSEETNRFPEDGPLPERFMVPENLTHLLLDGYWQDYRVVQKESLNDLRNRLASVVSEKVKILADQIGNSQNPTAVHVRRHDYKHHGLCAENYYRDTILWLQQRHANISFYVFSDEPNYTRHFLDQAGVNAKFINCGDDLGDLYIMSKCTRHIISNSSYSWWAAVLSNSDFTIYPSPWSYIGSVSKRMFPAEWAEVNGAVENGISSRNFYNLLGSEMERIEKLRCGSKPHGER